MWKHITSKHYNTENVENGGRQDQGETTYRNFHDSRKTFINMAPTGACFLSLLRMDLPEGHAIISVFMSSKLDSNDTFVAARVICASAQIDPAKLRVQVDVPLQTNESLTCYIRPPASCGSIDQDVWNARRELRDHALAIAITALCPSACVHREQSTFGWYLTVQYGQGQDDMAPSSRAVS